MTSINGLTWAYIDRHIEIKKTILHGLVNVSALARKIAKEHHIEQNIDAIISAIRRYEGKTEKREEFKKYYDLLKKARISSKSKLTSILIKRTDETEKKVAIMYQKIHFRRNTNPLSFEITNHIKIVIDDHLSNQIKELFISSEIEHIDKGLGELTIEYAEEIVKVSGKLFAIVVNELAMNNIAIIDSMICHQEHVIIIKEDELDRAFKIIFELTR